MHYPRSAYLTAVVLACPTIVVGESIISTSESPTCTTITETTGSGCPAITEFCARPQCIELQTITLDCGCPSIFSTTVCPTTCPKGCGITYDTVYIPCGTSLSSPPPITTTSTSTSISPIMSLPPTSTPSSISITSTSTSISPILSLPPTSTPSSTSTVYHNSTMTSTSTNIVIITNCPTSLACTGQTTTWTGTTGPLTCPASSTCSGVLPGGDQTVTETTVAGKTGPTPTSSAPGSASSIQANEGSRYGFGIVEGGVLLGLIGAVLGMM